MNNLLKTSLMYFKFGLLIGWEPSADDGSESHPVQYGRHEGCES